ncbi:radical SAM protein, partial [Desulfonema ishimotonii]|uniref:radical SAM protein n=1 Tax=Desulfonema ishimotonii TaxID=45657 RepID=UPI00140DBD20
MIPEKRNPAFAHSFETIGLPVITSHGCCMNCAYCVEPRMTDRVTVRPEEEIIHELVRIADQYPDVFEIFFVNTEFNIPTPDHSLGLVKQILARGLEKRFHFSSQFLPIRFNEEYAEHLSRAGFYVILTCDSFSDPILKLNNSPYREKDIVHTLDLLERFQIRCTLNLIFGLPGETLDTMDHTLEMIKRYTVQGSGQIKFEYTAGARIYNNTGLARYVKRHHVSGQVYGKSSKGYPRPCFFCSPASPRELNAAIEPKLPFKQEFVPSRPEEDRIFRKIAFYTDRETFKDATQLFSRAPLQIKSRIFDYL